jgi:hypothetical protein
MGTSPAASGKEKPIAPSSSNKAARSSDREENQSHLQSPFANERCPDGWSANLNCLIGKKRGRPFSNLDVSLLLQELAPNLKHITKERYRQLQYEHPQLLEIDYRKF